eukprot:gnl/Spiro4/29275_TR14316_c0_g1_i1.p1 gnl/Spiro4/29275_TR14316_c0_g1~~gnl/Spiro4/29275_TR14316_c0_g1_i1.p1  ORF type:complete len:397 (+),score=99.19 gnl/Spiro4/29275_TR14316_c0_g1_i1:69-1193(+)
MFARIRASLAAFEALPDLPVRINAPAIEQFVEAIDLEEFGHLQQPRPLPARFATVDDEVNFHCMTSVLAIGHSERHILLETVDRSSSETTLYGVMAMHMSADCLDAAYMKSLTVSDVSTLFGFPISVMVQVQPGIEMSQPGPLRPLANKILSILHECADVLQRAHYKSFAEYIFAAIGRATENTTTTTPAPTTTATTTASSTTTTTTATTTTTNTAAVCVTAAQLVERLTASFPNLADTSLFRGVQVLLMKKAQLLVTELHRRLPGIFNFPDMDQMTVFADNALPCVLHHHNILQYPAELERVIAAHEPLEGELEVAVRACTMIACDRICESLAQRRNVRAAPHQLDHYLFTRSRHNPLYANLPRHRNPSTLFY